MQQIGIWRVTDDGLDRLDPSSVGLEKNLEDWIEDDPSLLEEGLEIVGRQLHVEGGYLDLLGLNAQGQWVVIELKSGAVRRGTITQVLDYASCIARMPWDELRRKVTDYLKRQERSVGELVDENGEVGDDSAVLRDVVMYVVGTGSYPGLERMIDFLGGVHGVPITLVSYEVFQIGHQHKILVRELTEPEIEPTTVKKSRTVEELCSRAEKHGIGHEFRLILEVARRHGIYPRPYTGSIMYTPPSNRTRMLFTVKTWTQSDGLLRLYVGPEAFAEFYPVEVDEVAALLGEAGWQHMTTEDVKAFVGNLDLLFVRMAKDEEAERVTP